MAAPISGRMMRVIRLGTSQAFGRISENGKWIDEVGRSLITKIKPRSSQPIESDPMDLKEILNSTKVGELTLKAGPTLALADSVSVAAAEMRNRSHGSVLICSDNRVVGIFTERDLLKVVGSGADLSTPLSEVMTAAPQTVTTQDSLFDAMHWMDEGGYRRLPVVDPSSAPVGIIDVKGVVHYLVEHFPSAVYNQASHAQLIARHREGA